MVLPSLLVFLHLIGLFLFKLSYLLGIVVVVPDSLLPDLTVPTLRHEGHLLVPLE